MTPQEIANYADKLIVELAAMQPVGYNNYKVEITEYRRILRDLLVLIRENAKNSIPPP